MYCNKTALLSFICAGYETTPQNYSYRNGLYALHILPCMGRDRFCDNHLQHLPQQRQYYDLCAQQRFNFAIQYYRWPCYRTHTKQQRIQ